MHKVITALIMGLVLFMACLGGSSTGPSAQDIHGWIAGEPTASGVTILHTTDGSNWTAQGTQLLLPGVNIGSVSAVDSLTAWATGGYSGGYGVVLRTADAGENWTRVGSQADLPSGVLAIAALSADVAWAAGSDNAVYRTTDGGVNWDDLSDPAFDGSIWQGIYVVNQSDVWVCGGTSQAGMIIHTTDGGAQWTSHAASVLQEYGMISIAAWDASNVWSVGSGFTIVKTTDGGSTWDLVTPDSLQASPNDANGICLLSADEAWAVLDYGNIWRTTDGGDNWTFQTVPTEVTGFFMLRISAQDSNTAWVTGRSGYGTPVGVILHTTDGGSTWTRQDDGSYAGLWGISFEGDLPN